MYEEANSVRCVAGWAVVFLILMAVQASIVGGHTKEDVERLLRDKTENLTRTFRPVHNQTLPIVINTAFDLVSLQEFDEVLEKITATGLLYLLWYDEYFIWDPKDYGGADYIVIEASRLWVPLMVLTNSVNKIEPVYQDWHLLTVDYTGLVRYYPGSILSASCTIDVTYYPWDRQSCEFMFMPWGYSPDRVHFAVFEEKILTSYYEDNGVWELVDSSTDINLELVMVSFRLVLDRKPRFIVVNVIMPIVFMSFLNVLIFLIPVDSGERISFCLTVLLAIAVFLTLVSDNLPKTSNPMSIFSYYLLSVLMISVVITLITIGGLHMYYKDENEEVGPFWRAFTRFVNCKCGQRRRRRRGRNSQYVRNDADKYGQERSRVSDRSTYTSTDGSLRSPYPKMLTDVRTPDRPLNGNANGSRMLNGKHTVWSTGHTDPTRSGSFTDTSGRSGEYSSGYNSNRCGVDNRREAGPQEAMPVDDITWKDVSLALDKVSFIFLFLGLLADTVVFMVMISTGTTSQQD